MCVYMYGRVKWPPHWRQNMSSFQSIMLLDLGLNTASHKCCADVHCLQKLYQNSLSMDTTIIIIIMKSSVPPQKYFVATSGVIFSAGSNFTRICSFSQSFSICSVTSDRRAWLVASHLQLMIWPLCCRCHFLSLYVPGTLPSLTYGSLSKSFAYVPRNVPHSLPPSLK